MTALLKQRRFMIPLAAFVVTRAICLLAELVLMTYGPLFAPLAVGGKTWITIWAQWDTNWYLSIAQNGYVHPLRDVFAFFPVFPLMMRAGALVTGDPLVAGLILSNVCFYLGLVMLYELIATVRDETSAAWTVWYMALFPISVFFTAAYTESLFLLLSVMCAYCALKHRWGLAAACGAIASASRVPGVLLIIVAGMEWAKVHGWTLHTALQKSAWQNLWHGIRTDFVSLLKIALIPSGLLVYMAYNWMVTGSAFTFRNVQISWEIGTNIVDTIRNRILLMGTLQPYEVPGFPLVEIASFFMAMVIVVILFRKRYEGWALYCFLALFLPMWTRTLGMPRYVMVLFPVIWVLAEAGRRWRWFQRFYLVISLSMLFFFTIAFLCTKVVG